MKLNTYSRAIAAVVAATLVQSFIGEKPAAAVSLTALTSTNTLISFDSATPGTTSSLAVSGIAGSLIGIDYRPANNLLYGVSDASQIYTINTSTGAATLASTLSTNFTSGVQSGVDFNPVPNLLRLVGSNDQNLRVNVDTGATTVDGTLAYAAGDLNFGQNPNITASAYTNSDIDPNTGTTLYGIDSDLNNLVMQNPPNAGTLTTVGSLNTNVGSTGGFDIFTENGNNTAFAAFDSTLYSIDLGTGLATNLGAIGGSPTVVGLAAAPNATPVPFEPSPTLGLLGLGAWAAVSQLKNRKRLAKLSQKN